MTTHQIRCEMLEAKVAELEQAAAVQEEILKTAARELRREHEAGIPPHVAEELRLLRAVEDKLSALHAHSQGLELTEARREAKAAFDQAWTKLRAFRRAGK